MRFPHLILIQLVFIYGLLHVISASSFGWSDDAGSPQDQGEHKGKQIVFKMSIRTNHDYASGYFSQSFPFPA